MAYYEETTTREAAQDVEADKDQRLSLMERLVRMERGYERANEDAERAAGEANKMHAELKNVRNELFKLLRVVDADQPRGER